MASSSAPRILAFKCDAAITAGKAVKAGATSDGYVQVCSAATDKMIGVIQNTTTAVDGKSEVAINGGGAKGLLAGTVAMGDKLTCDSTGGLVATTTENDYVVGVAMVAGVSGDIIGIEVALGGGGP